jgi:hypothetical protein
MVDERLTTGRAGRQSRRQHDKHVQHDNGHEQDDENPQNRPERLGERDDRQEYSCAVHVRDRDRHRAVSRRDSARLFHVPAAAVAYTAD